ncbi:MAG: hypothetical protein ACJAYE_002498 [Candidatus Azotimanducaceae bacterium]|jgi:hypothetical protein
MPYIVVTIIKALQRVDPGTLARNQAPYDSALQKMGIEDVTDYLGG